LIRRFSDIFPLISSQLQYICCIATWITIYVAALLGRFLPFKDFSRAIIRAAFFFGAIRSIRPHICSNAQSRKIVGGWFRAGRLRPDA
jgi:hypothetical protein